MRVHQLVDETHEDGLKQGPVIAEVPGEPSISAVKEAEQLPEAGSEAGETAEPVTAQSHALAD